MASKINWIRLIIGAFLISRKIFTAGGNSMNGDMAAHSSQRTTRSDGADWNNYRVAFPQRHREIRPLRRDRIWDNLGHEFRAEDAVESVHHNKREAAPPTPTERRMIEDLLRELQADKEQPKNFHHCTPCFNCYFNCLCTYSELS
ncbi:uncharacterized protein LOC105219126 [Zeugodacus cucurbitae]|uniref:uncharacterized protein LOC105219126 n=1 Tax=Zeugodacus cucurbitae TaxID=28588 RepID=UPI0023D92A2C|nr:uncharacterized protein LOC105219126 [Zeugodacus cucurbitae]